MARSLVQLIQSMKEKIAYRWNLLVRYRPSPFGPAYQNAWNHRYELFDRFDNGIETDAVGLYSVTPRAVARRIATPFAGQSVVDAFCGIGGNAIAFAEVCPVVYAIDIDAARLGMARNNAAVYGRRNIEFINGNFLEIAPNYKADAVFLDPPWGGPSYSNKPQFLLTDFIPDGELLLRTAFQHYARVVLRVPVNFDFAELSKFHKRFSVTDDFVAGHRISKTVFFE